MLRILAPRCWWPLTRSSPSSPDPDHRHLAGWSRRLTVLRWAIGPLLIRARPATRANVIVSDTGATVPIMCVSAIGGERLAGMAHPMTAIPLPPCPSTDEIAEALDCPWARATDLAPDDERLADLRQYCRFMTTPGAPTRRSLPAVGCPGCSPRPRRWMLQVALPV